MQVRQTFCDGKVSGRFATESERVREDLKKQNKKHSLEKRTGGVQDSACHQGCKVEVQDRLFEFACFVTLFAPVLVHV